MFQHNKNILKLIDINRQTPLHLAIILNKCKIVENILTYKNSITNDSEGNNELHIWVESECEICFNNLINKIDNNYLQKKNNKSFNPLHLSIVLCKFEAFIKLINFGFNLDETDDDNNTLLHLSCIYGNLVILVNLENI